MVDQEEQNYLRERYSLKGYDRPAKLKQQADSQKGLPHQKRHHNQRPSHVGLNTILLLVKICKIPRAPLNWSEHKYTVRPCPHPEAGRSEYSAEVSYF